MLTTLLIVILISFIGVGLPDSVLGTAWPAMYREFALPISLAGYIGMVVSLGTIVSSLMSAFLIKRLGTGLLTAISTLLTALALLGFSFTSHPAFFFLLAFPLGLGAGAIDTALNNFVALHYSAAKMSFLHCFYGIGVAVSPFIMSMALGNDGDWRRGYFIVALLQAGITFLTFLSLPLWSKIQKRDRNNGEEIEERTLSLGGLLKMRKVRLSCFAFFTICSLELTAGMWCSSYFVNVKNMPPDRSALITMLFYVGLTLGRFLSGVFANRLGRRRILRISLYILPVALALFALPFNVGLSAAALLLVGVGVGPVYPNLSHLTPKLFGKEITSSVMGVQQASTYIGVLLMPTLFGLLAEYVTPKLLPYFLMVHFLLYAWSLVLLLRKKKG